MDTPLIFLWAVRTRWRLFIIIQHHTPALGLQVFELPGAYGPDQRPGSHPYQHR